MPLPGIVGDMKAEQKKSKENIKNTRILIIVLAFIAVSLGVLQFALSNNQPEQVAKVESTPSPTTELRPLTTPSPTPQKLVIDPDSKLYEYPQYGYRIQIPKDVSVTETKVKSGVWLKMSYEGVTLSAFAGTDLTADIKNDMTTYQQVNSIVDKNQTWETYEFNPCDTKECKQMKYISVLQKDSTAYALRYTVSPELGKTMLGQIEISEPTSPSATPKPTPKPTPDPSVSEQKE